jgi:hypothetical protein
MTSRASQRQRILELLLSARGDWVPLPRVQACAAQYNARLYELRRLGFRITNRIREVNGQRHSWFCLAVADLPAQRTVSGVTGNLSAAAASFPEFGSLPKEAGHPD